jgi:3-methylcrotonyl-CoA carboxylase alpha subunit
MTLYREPDIPGIRIDTGISGKTEIQSSFDPMICKLVVWGRDRHEARQTMISALGGYVIHGISTNILYLTRLLQSDAFKANLISTRFCDDHTTQLVAETVAERNAIPLQVPVAGYLISTMARKAEIFRNYCEPESLWTTIGYWRNRMDIRMTFGDRDIIVSIPSGRQDQYDFIIEGEPVRVSLMEQAENMIVFSIGHNHYRTWVSEDAEGKAYISTGNHIFRMWRHDILPESVTAFTSESHGGHGNYVTSPMPGKVIKIHVGEGDQVKKGDVLMIIEAMKMENAVVAPRHSVIGKINVAVNDRVETSTPLVYIEENKE